MGSQSTHHSEVYILNAETCSSYFPQDSMLIFKEKKQNKTKKEWFKTSSNAFEKNGIVLIIY